MAGCSRRPPTASATTSSATTPGPAAAAARRERRRRGWTSGCGRMCLRHRGRAMLPPACDSGIESQRCNSPAVVGTGLAVAVPEGYAAFVHPRSGLAARHGIALVNAPGTIDAGYRGEVKVILINTDPA